MLADSAKTLREALDHTADAAIELDDVDRVGSS
jgi:hypothetical protein